MPLNQVDGKPFISISRDGRMRASLALIREEGLDYAEYVKVYTDVENDAIAVQFLSVKTDNCAKIAYSDAGSGSWSVGPLMKRHNWTAPKYFKKYEVQKQTEDGTEMFVIRLNG